MEDRRPPAQSPVRELTPARDTDLGPGMRVRRLLPVRNRVAVGAWCFFDHFGPVEVAGTGGLRVPPHPHIGLQTVTWLLEGDVLHRDSLGSERHVRPDQLNLMTAGRGIAHSEETPAGAPAILHGVQLWVALPGASSEVDPSFDHYPELPVVEGAGMRTTVLLGQLLGATSPARTYSDLVGADIRIAAGASDDVAIREDFEHAVAVLDGEASIDGVALRPGSLLYLGSGRVSVSVEASEPARVLLLGGAPIAESLYLWWNFVAHSATEIEAARADWEAGRRFLAVDGFDGPAMSAPPLPPGTLKPRR
jgi:redox-sensitive bicupin YhaK (pirin superfamily)